MSIMTTVEAREHFSEFINKTAFGKERVMLTRRGKNIAALVPLEDLALLESAEDERDVRDAKLAIAEARKKGSISLAEFKKELGEM